jgi:hypothetical protein
LNKEIELFKSLFDNTPSLALLYFKDANGVFENTLNEIVEKNFGTIKTIEDNYTKRVFSSREYEYAIIEDIFDEIDDKFIKKVYHSLENSAFIILISKKDKKSILELSEILDNNDFRAINSIDIFEEYNLVMAKKLHMWGNGL